MKKVFAAILTIGDELLIGQTVDTNSTWMARALNEIGVWVKRRTAVGDDWDEIWNALDEESTHADIILITGGLGPTADDITKPLLCKYFGGTMVENEAVKNHIIDIFTRMKRPLLDRNLRQAEVPDVCTVLFNERGTAPGMWFEKNGKIFVSMPGVPHEMKGIMEQHVLPRLPQHFTMPHILHHTLLTAGAGESFIAERLQGFEAGLPENMKLAYLPNYGMVRLRLTVTGEDKTSLQTSLNHHFEILKKEVADLLVIDRDEPLEKALGNLLRTHGKTVATAESCTGGYISHLITSIAGSSDYYKGSVIAYAYDAKEKILGVNHPLMVEKGAVSEEVVKQMVSGVLEQTGADFAVATSGIMGPGGETPDKPVGTVWMAAGSADKIIAKKSHFRFDRKKNIEITANHALHFLYEFIRKETAAADSASNL